MIAMVWTVMTNLLVFSRDAKNRRRSISDKRCCGQAGKGLGDERLSAYYLTEQEDTGKEEESLNDGEGAGERFGLVLLEIVDAGGEGLGACGERTIEMESSRMKMRNMRSQPAKIPGLRSGMVMRLSVVAQEARQAGNSARVPQK